MLSTGSASRSRLFKGVFDQINQAKEQQNAPDGGGGGAAGQVSGASSKLATGNVSSHIANAYQQHLGRAPDTKGMEYWADQVDSLGMDGVVSHIANSPEAARFQQTGRPGVMYGRDFDSGNFIDSMDPRATTEGRLENLLSSDSRLMRLAATQGKQQAASRGLLNSSMAVGAAQDAMARTALPIAQQDAKFFQTGALANQQHVQDLQRLQASSTANAWGVMANNVTDIVAQGMEGIANIQANPDIEPEDKTKMIEQITAMRDTDIQFQQDLYASLSSYLADTGLFPNL